MSFTPATIRDNLRERDLLKTAKDNTGAYAIELAPTKRSTEGVREEWLALPANRVAPPRGTLAPIANANKLLYVGAAHQSIYDRLTDHATGHYSATVMDVFPPQDVYGIYPDEREYNVATRLSDGNVVCWTDGRVV